MCLRERARGSESGPALGRAVTSSKEEAVRDCV
ncbi:MAG: hypothetical protein GIKADHBN_00148 [Phycisphaerales bacterium]|nr:hypothetical protein [Phycisphaerales bacterium]